MRTETVEICSDATNAAVMRHPERNFPGVLIQGDTLHSICSRVDDICASARSELGEETYLELNELRNHLWDLLRHYKVVLTEHEIPIPFSEDKRF